VGTFIISDRLVEQRSTAHLIRQLHQQRFDHTRCSINVAIFLLERTNLRPENVNLTFLPFETPGKVASNRRRYPADHSSGHRFPLVDWRPRANNTAFPDWSNAPGRKKIIVPVVNAWPRALVLRGHNPAGTGARRTTLMRTCRPER
jgi:hypothetical protein